MKQTIKICNTASFSEALQSVASANLVILIAPSPVFDDCASHMKLALSDVPNIGICGQGYAESKDHPEDIMLVGFYDCHAVVDVIRDANQPILSVDSLMHHVTGLAGNKSNTVCLDFTTGNDSVIVTTFNACLNEKQIPLIGATAWDNKVSCNGIVYQNACVYAFLTNKTGSIHPYKENIYCIDETMPAFTATKIDAAAQKIVTLNNQKASSVYQNALHISENDIENQTFQNPIGRLVGDDIFIISVKNKCPDGSLECYKRANPMDALTILQLGDYEKIIQETVSQIKRDFPKLSGVFSINCILRYLMFQDLHYWDDYLKTMNQLGTHIGIVGCGEHFLTQHVNQTMTCFAFD